MLQWIIKNEIDSINVNGRKINLNMRKGHSILEDLTDIDTQDLINMGFIPRAVRWESGGGYSNTGDSNIICGIDGASLKPVFVKTKGHLACGEHAMFLFYPGQPWVEIEVSRWRSDYNVLINKYVLKNDGEIEKETIWKIENVNDVINELPTRLKKFEEAIKVAIEKSNCYHCRLPHYIKK